MTAARRWTLVALGVCLLVAVPLAIRAIPAAESELSSATLLQRAQGSSSVAYSGYVESTGSLALPVADRFTDISDLLGSQTTMRVWWRGPDEWRVDAIGLTGETDLVHDASGTTVWDYESNEATRTRDPDVRLPQSSDLLPPELARRLLDGASPDEVTSIEARDVAEVDAAGLRLDPAAVQSSIDHVDVWVDPASGLPLAVEIFGNGGSNAAVSTKFVDVSVTEPSPERTRLVLAPGTRQRNDDVIDIADAANQYAPFRVPMTLAGLPRRDSTTRIRAVGVYGRGPVLLTAIPLWEEAACPLREQLAVTPGAVIDEGGTSLGVGPLNLRLTTSENGSGFLVVGTVTQQTLVRAAHQLEQRLTQDAARRASGPPRTR